MNYSIVNAERFLELVDIRMVLLVQQLVDCVLEALQRILIIDIRCALVAKNKTNSL